MTERGHDWDTLQCRIKVKELQKASHKAREANRRSGAAPTSCRFYKELDAILGGDPTSTAKATVDTSVVHVLVESGLSQEEEILDEDVEGDPAAEDDSEVRGAGSQELFSTPEEASQSQLSDLGEAQTGEEAPDETLGAQPPSLLAPAERQRRIRKWPRKTKEDFLRDVMMHSMAEKQELKKWQDSEKRDRKENVACQNEATEQLLNVMECQADTLQVLLALQTEQLRAHPPLQPLSQISFPCAPPDTANTLLSTSWLQTVPAAFHSCPVTVQPCGLPVPTALNTHPSAV
ncbi:uncharacterized protein LOC135975795 [Chrysemys picta bellii]|uniref:uncharacterized protein LOC135975795 n=1 Tax=Chrysemys picta bellii TaxID=8478 RepID=UPI0032B264F0